MKIIPIITPSYANNNFQKNGSYQKKDINFGMFKTDNSSIAEMIDKSNIPSLVRLKKFLEPVEDIFSDLLPNKLGEAQINFLLGAFPNRIYYLTFSEQLQANNMTPQNATKFLYEKMCSPKTTEITEEQMPLLNKIVKNLELKKRLEAKLDETEEAIDELQFDFLSLTTD